MFASAAGEAAGRWARSGRRGQARPPCFGVATLLGTVMGEDDDGDEGRDGERGEFSKRQWAWY